MTTKGIFDEVRELIDESRAPRRAVARHALDVVSLSDSKAFQTLRQMLTPDEFKGYVEAATADSFDNTHKAEAYIEAVIANRRQPTMNRSEQQ